MSENSIYCGEPDIKTMKDKIRRTLNICRLHIDGVWCVRATGQVILITREKLVAMAKVSTDIPGSLKKSNDQGSHLEK